MVRLHSFLRTGVMKMHVDKMTQGVTDFFEQASELTRRKNPDYHPDKVAYLEILQTAWETGVTVEQDMWGRIRKQMSALRRFVIEGYLESETPRSRMTDVAVYMGMMCVWVENKPEILRDAALFIHTRRECEEYGGTAGRNTCVSNGRSVQDACDRCSFLFWLNGHAGQDR